MIDAARTAYDLNQPVMERIAAILGPRIDRIPDRFIGSKRPGFDPSLEDKN